jgi:hypothetical protein
MPVNTTEAYEVSNSARGGIVPPYRSVLTQPSSLMPFASGEIKVERRCDLSRTSHDALRASSPDLEFLCDLTLQYYAVLY